MGLAEWMAERSNDTTLPLPDIKAFLGVAMRARQEAQRQLDALRLHQMDEAQASASLMEETGQTLGAMLRCCDDLTTATTGIARAADQLERVSARLVSRAAALAAHEAEHGTLDPATPGSPAF